ncbi:MAG TPA: hypothetical protein VKY56_00480 [Chloroflexota bacterium]|nr:hypothetical protein [Chloroflexota bacterium]
MMNESQSSGSISQWDEYVEQVRKQLPPAPQGLLDFYVRWVPWLAIVFGVISLFLLVVAGLIFTALSPLLLLGGAAGVSEGLGALLALILGIAGAALALVGGYLMLQRRLTGWWLIALALVVGFLTNLVHLAILGLIIDVLIAYIHVQVKPRYS